ncbi:MAG: preprotein translocase subunit SecG [Planctomycetota bacterium]
MDTLRTVLLVIFVLDSILLVLAILIQSGRGGGLAGALGGISSADSALGVRAASQIEKITGVLAVIFLGVALALAFIPHSKGVPEVPIGTREGVSGETTQPGRAVMTPPAARAATPAAKAATPAAKAVAATPAAKKGGSEE